MINQPEFLNNEDAIIWATT